MKKIFFIAIILILAGFGIYYAFKDRSSVPEITYNAQRTYLRASFTIPGDWKILAEDGQFDKYSQVIVLGPRNADKTYRANFVVRGSPVRSAGGRFGEPSEVKNNYLIHLVRKPASVAERTIRVAGMPAEMLVTERVLPPILHKGQVAVETDLKDKAVFFRVGDILYEVIYSADQADYGRWERNFETLVQSLTFSKS